MLSFSISFGLLSFCIQRHIVGNDFSVLHGMPVRTSDEKGARLSVCRSVKRVHCDKTEERSVQIFIPYERPYSLVFWEEEWLVEGDPFYLKFWVNRPPLSEIADFEPIFARSATPSEKSSINTNRKSTMRFPMSLRWSSYVVPNPSKGAQKRKVSKI